MGCKGCGEKKFKFNEAMVNAIRKSICDFTATDCEPLVLGCGSMVIFFKTDKGESEMYLKLKPDRTCVKVEGKVFHPTREIIEFRMALDLSDEKNAPDDERNIKDLEGRYIDPYGNAFELS